MLLASPQDINACCYDAVVVFVVNQCDIATAQWNGTHARASPVDPRRAYFQNLIFEGILELSTPYETRFNCPDRCSLGHLHWESGLRQIISSVFGRSCSSSLTIFSA